MVETVGGLKIDLDLDAKDFEASLKTIDKELDGLEKGLSDVGGKGFNNLDKSADQAAKSVRELGNAGKQAGKDIASGADVAYKAWREQSEKFEKIIGGMRTLGQTLTASLTVPIAGLMLGGAFGTQRISEMETAIGRLNNSFQTFGEIAQRTLVPVVNLVADVLDRTTNWFTGLSKGAQTAVIGIAGIAAAIGPATLAAAALLDTWKKVKDALFAAKMMQLEFNAASMLNPWTIALAAVVGSLAALELKNGSVSRSFALLEKAGTTAFTAIEKAVAPLKQRLDDTFSSLFGSRVTQFMNDFASGGLLTGFVGWLGNTGEAADDTAGSMNNLASASDAAAEAFKRQQDAISAMSGLYNEIGSAIDGLIGAQETKATAGFDVSAAMDKERDAATKYNQTFEKTSKAVKDVFNQLQRGTITGMQASEAINKMSDASKAEWKELTNVYTAWIQASEARRRYEVTAQQAAAKEADATAQITESAGKVGIAWDGSTGKLGALVDRMGDLLTVIRDLKRESPVNIDVNVNQNGSIQTGSYYPGQVVTNPATGQSITVSQPYIQPSAQSTLATTQYLTQSMPPDYYQTPKASPTIKIGQNDFASLYSSGQISNVQVYKAGEYVGKKTAESMNKGIAGTQSDVGKWVTTGFRQSESAGIVAAQTVAGKIASAWNSTLSVMKTPTFMKTVESVSSSVNPYAGMPVYYGGQGWQTSQGTTVNYGDGCVVGGGGSSFSTSIPTGTGNDPVSCVLVDPGASGSSGNFNASLWCDPAFITWLDNSFQEDMASVQAGAISAGYLKGSQVGLTKSAVSAVSSGPTYSATGEVVTGGAPASSVSILSDPSIVTDVAMRQINAGNIQAVTTRTSTAAVKDFGTTVQDTATGLQNHVTDIINNWQTQAAGFNNNMASYWSGIMGAFGISMSASGGGGGGASSGGYSSGGNSSGGISISNPITPGFKALVGSPVVVQQSLSMNNVRFTPEYTPRDVMNQVAADRNLALTKLGYR